VPFSKKVCDFLDQNGAFWCIVFLPRNASWEKDNEGSATKQAPTDSFIVDKQDESREEIVTRRVRKIFLK